MEDELYEIIKSMDEKRTQKPEENKEIVDKLGNKDIMKLKRDMFNKIREFDDLLKELEYVKADLNNKIASSGSNDLTNIIDHNSYLSNIDKSIKICNDLRKIIKKGYESVSKECLIGIYNSFYIVKSFGDENEKMTFKEYCENVIETCKNSIPRKCPICGDYNKPDLKSCEYCKAELSG